MKWATLSVALFFIPFSWADDKPEIEEMVVKAQKTDALNIVMVKLEENHTQSFWTKNWYYVESKQSEEEKD